jgi:mono/diheme cytochrome c family protein
MSPYFLSMTFALAICASTLSAEDTQLSIAMGAKTFAENCARCHETPDPSFHEGDSWRPISLHMRVFACISKEEQHQVLAFLQSQNTARIQAEKAALKPAATH